MTGKIERSELGRWGTALLATLWAMVGTPVFVVLLFGLGIDRLGNGAILYALLLGVILALIGYAASMFLIRRWSS